MGFYRILLDIYDDLLKEYGLQGWWPFINYNGVNTSKTGSITGYHPGLYDFPRNDHEKFEIILGSVLTQNTNWQSVEMALKNLDNISAIDPDVIISTDEDEIKKAIKCSGYYNQKYNYIMNVAEFFISLNGATPKRKELLKVKGVGNETADSILLYAYKKEEFIVDAYTRRIFSYLGYINLKDSYGRIKKFFEKNLKDYDGDKVIFFQEFHALIVEHAKNYYLKKPYGEDDKLLDGYIIEK